MLCLLPSSYKSGTAILREHAKELTSVNPKRVLPINCREYAQILRDMVKCIASY